MGAAIRDRANGWLLVGIFKPGPAARIAISPLAVTRPRFEMKRMSADVTRLPATGFPAIGMQQADLGGVCGRRTYAETPPRVNDFPLICSADIPTNTSPSALLTVHLYTGRIRDNILSLVYLSQYQIARICLDPLFKSRFALIVSSRRRESPRTPVIDAGCAEQKENRSAVCLRPALMTLPVSGRVAGTAGVAHATDAAMPGAGSGGGGGASTVVRAHATDAAVGRAGVAVSGRVADPPDPIQQPVGLTAYMRTKRREQQMVGCTGSRRVPRPPDLPARGTCILYRQADTAEMQQMRGCTGNRRGGGELDDIASQWACPPSPPDMPARGADWHSGGSACMHNRLPGCGGRTVCVCAGTAEGARATVEGGTVAFQGREGIASLSGNGRAEIGSLSGKCTCGGSTRNSCCRAGNRSGEGRRRHVRRDNDAGRTPSRNGKKSPACREKDVGGSPTFREEHRSHDGDTKPQTRFLRGSAIAARHCGWCVVTLRTYIQQACAYNSQYWSLLRVYIRQAEPIILQDNTTGLEPTHGKKLAVPRPQQQASVHTIDLARRFARQIFPPRLGSSNSGFSTTDRVASIAAIHGAESMAVTKKLSLSVSIGNSSGSCPFLSTRQQEPVNLGAEVQNNRFVSAIKAQEISQANPCKRILVETSFASMAQPRRADRNEILHEVGGLVQLSGFKTSDICDHTNGAQPVAGTTLYTSGSLLTPRFSHARRGPSQSRNGRSPKITVPS
ncbi:hypothetical protein Bbelb_098760 [Branchiostoma belcheri]|nr:hypothetical protein Bbelb_098760 [Branchiostoma belcheri]